VYIETKRKTQGLVEVMNKLIFNNLHNPPPTKYVVTIINPLYLKQLLYIRKCSLLGWRRTTHLTEREKH
jgi:hypothetical protein